MKQSSLIIDTNRPLPPGRDGSASSIPASLISPLGNSRLSFQLQTGAPLPTPVDVYNEWDDPSSVLSSAVGSLADIANQLPPPGQDDPSVGEVDESELIASLFGPLGPLGATCMFCAGFVAFAYAAIMSKMLPATGIWWMDAIREDRYYCFMVPLVLPLTIYHVIWNWFGLKLFRHN
ncbi:phosphatidylinositol N-acetylglucosaminyltransferase subunit Y-domain-containing protein [Catenaria anguillulae PL171]|uniref:Phosphatidylinositol N-acetylglucosaminyltransferase subunit Y-domain-containing protein n=1 Tax=Catenaria anguillulae PL171 TaxID=765915 RepID=A0A1Y2GZ61_9FUNG|nr:phosphatidylinositol N-acetylglucosaminyltransferase subunit Y-domain-containing protein [Catenaria anguillulae PL171]